MNYGSRLREKVPNGPYRIKKKKEKCLVGAHSVTIVTYTSYTVFCPLSKIIYYLSFPIKNTIFSIVNIWKSSDRSDCPIPTDTGTTHYGALYKTILWGL